VAHGDGRGTGLADVASAPGGDLAGLKNRTKEFEFKQKKLKCVYHSGNTVRTNLNSSFYILFHNTLYLFLIISLIHEVFEFIDCDDLYFFTH
jgi:hypothetical protein